MLFSILAVILAQFAPAVPPPGPVGKLFVGTGIIFHYPATWDAVPVTNQTIFFPSAARIPKPNSNLSFYTHGMFMALYHPSTPMTLEQASETLFRSFQQSNPGMGLLSSKTMKTKGHDTYVMEYTNTQSESPFGLEHGLLVTVQEAHGIWYWLMFAPNSQWSVYGDVFNQVWASITIVIEPAVQTYEHAPHVELVRRVTSRLQNNQFRMPRFRMFVEDADVINAYSLPEASIVVVPSGLIHFFQDDEGELAFVIAHELGHVQDEDCKALIRSVGGKLTKDQSRSCEARADEIGLQFLVGANYNAYDSAASFGRMMMFTGETDPLDIMMKRYAQDHPVDVDRIADLRKTLQNYCSKNPAKCRPVGE